MNSIAIRLKLLRVHLGYTQGTFGDVIGCTQVVISRYESGRGIPTDFICTLYEKFNINIHWLFTGDGDMFVQQEPIEDRVFQRISALEQRVKQLERIQST